VREELIQMIQETNKRIDETNRRIDRLYEVIVRREEHSMLEQRVANLEREVAELKRKVASVKSLHCLFPITPSDNFRLTCPTSLRISSAQSMASSASVLRFCPFREGLNWSNVDVSLDSFHCGPSPHSKGPSIIL